MLSQYMHTPMHVQYQKYMQILFALNFVTYEHKYSIGLASFPGLLLLISNQELDGGKAMEL